MAIPVAKSLGLHVYTNGSGSGDNEARVKRLGAENLIDTECVYIGKRQLDLQRKESRYIQADATTLFYIRSSFLFLTHVRIKDCRRGGEGFFDCVRAEPAKHVQCGSRLIVGAGSSCASEGLLSDHRAGALVIDVEVSGSVAKRFLHLCNHLAILYEDSTGQIVRRSGYFFASLITRRYR